MTTLEYILIALVLLFFLLFIAAVKSGDYSDKSKTPKDRRYECPQNLKYSEQSFCHICQYQNTCELLKTKED